MSLIKPYFGDSRVRKLSEGGISVTFPSKILGITYLRIVFMEWVNFFKFLYWEEIPIFVFVVKFSSWELCYKITEF